MKLFGKIKEFVVSRPEIVKPIVVVASAIAAIVVVAVVSNKIGGAVEGGEVVPVDEIAVMPE